MQLSQLPRFLWSVTDTSNNKVLGTFTTRREAREFKSTLNTSANILRYSIDRTPTPTS